MTTASPCRSGRHLRADDERDSRGYRRCRACLVEGIQGRRALGARARGSRWAHPVADPARQVAFTAWSSGLTVAIRTIRLAEGHNGDGWQTLGEYLHEWP